MTEESYEYLNQTVKVPSELKGVIQQALSFYPRLRNEKIDFVFNENIRKSVMQAQPRYTSMYGSRKRRKYIVKISHSFEMQGKTTPIQDLPEKVLIGWIGHELGHIMDYLQRNNWSMFLFGLGYYTSKSFIISAERVADTYAINHNLGDYILATKEFILHESGMPEKYIQRIKRLYLSPEEIIDMVEKRSSGD